MQRLPDVMAWLDADVPLTLVMDLLDEHGPRSERILRDERPTPAQLEWLAALTRQVTQPAAPAPTLLG